MAFAVLFQAEAAAAIRVWWDSKAFGHCFLVLPIAAWLGWDRRARLYGLAPRPLPGLAVLALPLAGLWLAAERLGIMEARQFLVLFMVWLLALAVLGWRAGRAMAVPLAYLVFLVPFGAFLVPVLQGFTAGFIDFGLGVLEVPHAVTATLIEIPEGRFQVAEACAGLRFLIAAIAFGTLYACMLYRSAWRRAAFILVCVVAPILANGVRALSIVLLGHWKGSAEAGAIDHVLYGWLFFSAVILLLVVMGLPFRQDVAPVPSRQPAALPWRSAPFAALAAAAAVVLLTAPGPAAALWLNRPVDEDLKAADQPERLAQAIVPPPGCTALPQVGAARRFACGAMVLDMRVQVFDQRAGPAALHAWRDAAAGGGADDVAVSWLDLPDARWRVAAARDPDSTVAAMLWLGGVPAPDGLALRLRLGLGSLAAAWQHGGKQAVMITVSMPATGQSAIDLITRFSAAQTGGVTLF